MAKVVDYEDGRSCPAAKTCLPRPIGVATGEIGEQSRRLGEGDGVAAATCKVSECLSDHRLSYTDRAVEHHRFAGFDEAKRGEVADACRGDLLVV